jgi:hypothetical protein
MLLAFVFFFANVKPLMTLALSLISAQVEVIYI